MQIYNDYKEYTSGNGSVVVLGKFDGVHIGHNRLFEMARAIKKDMSIIAFTFDINKNNKVLTDVNERRCHIKKQGVDVIIEQSLSDAFFEMPADVFLQKVLVESLNVKAIVCGNDFHFGKERSGNIQYLEACADTYGYKLVVVEKEQYDNNVISSTVIRDKLLNGMIEDVNRMLGYNYYIRGTVVHGKKLARQFDYPTANIRMPEGKISPRFGVYATLVLIDGCVYHGVSNVGIRPSFDDGEAINVETFLLDFKGDIYDKSVVVKFVKFFRDEIKFVNEVELFKQIDSDVHAVRAFWTENV